jgi:hypothetical protein
MLRILLSALGPTLIEKGGQILGDVATGTKAFVRDISEQLGRGSNFWQSLKSAGTNVLNRFLGGVNDNQVANKMPMMVTNQAQTSVMSRGIGRGRMGGTAAGFPTYIPGSQEGAQRGTLRAMKAEGREFGGVPQSVRVPRLKRRMGENRVITKRGQKGAVSFKRYI